MMFSSAGNIAARQALSSHRNDLSGGGTTAIVLSFLFTSLATIAVALRFWTRRIKRIGTFIEDWLILVALVC